MKTIMKLFVLSLFVAGSVVMVGGCGDTAKKEPEKPAAETPKDGDKKAGEGSDNASVTPAAEGITQVVFSVSGMS